MAEYIYDPNIEPYLNQGYVIESIKPIGRKVYSRYDDLVTLEHPDGRKFYALRKEVSE